MEGSDSRALQYSRASFSVSTIPTETHGTLVCTSGMDVYHETIPKQGILNSWRKFTDCTRWDHKQPHPHPEGVRTVSLLDNRTAVLCVGVCVEGWCVFLAMWREWVEGWLRPYSLPQSVSCVCLLATLLSDYEMILIWNIINPKFHLECQRYLFYHVSVFSWFSFQTFRL